MKLSNTSLGFHLILCKLEIKICFEIENINQLAAIVIMMKIIFQNIEFIISCKFYETINSCSVPLCNMSAWSIITAKMINHFNWFSQCVLEFPLDTGLSFGHGHKGHVEEWKLQFTIFKLE